MKHSIYSSNKDFAGFFVFRKELFISELLNIIISSIAGPNPMGEDVKYDSDFDSLKSEIGKLGNIDYDLIEQTGKKILKEKSKDIRVLCFLSYAFLHSSQWESFADVFDGFATLAQQNLDGLFPEKLGAKQSALQWLSQPRYNECCLKIPEEKNYEHVARLLKALIKLQDLLLNKFPANSPFPSTLYSVAVKWENQCKPKPKAEQNSSTQASSNPQEIMETPSQAQTMGKKSARLLIEKEPQKAMGYRLFRSLRWDILEKAPPSENGKTKLQPPSPEIRSYFQNTSSVSDSKAVLTKAEDTFACGANHLWFPLQRAAACAAKTLGEPYSQVYTAILLETGIVVKRIPELLLLCFSDGTPFCDDLTKTWIASEVNACFSNASTIGRAPAETGKILHDRMEEEKEEAFKLAGSGQIEKALDLLQNAIRNSASERDNFRRSILLCDLLMSNKHADIALSILESLEEKIVAYHLDKWDPDLAVEAWSHTVKALKAARGNNPVPSMQEKQTAVLNRISQIDPKKAFSLKT